MIMLGGKSDHSALLKTIFEIYSNEKKAKINVKIIYGSESLNSYKRAKEFLNELIEFFKNIITFCKEIKRITCENENITRNETNELEVELLEYFRSYLRERKKVLLRKNEGKGLLIKRKETTDEGSERNVRNVVNVVNVVNNEQNRMHNDKQLSELNNDLLDAFGRNVKTSSDTVFSNYVDCYIKTSISTVHIDFIDGNEFDHYSFFDNLEYYDLNILLLFVSTSNYGSFPKNCYKLEEHLKDLLKDNKIENNLMKNIFYSSIGFGNKQYGTNYFCAPISTCDRLLSTLGANKLYRTLKLCNQEDNEEIISEWKCNLFKMLSLSIFFYCFNYATVGRLAQLSIDKTYMALKYYFSFFCSSKQKPALEGVQDDKLKRKKKKKKKGKRMEVNMEEREANELEVGVDRGEHMLTQTLAQTQRNKLHNKTEQCSCSFDSGNESRSGKSKSIICCDEKRMNSEGSLGNEVHNGNASLCNSGSSIGIGCSSDANNSGHAANKRKGIRQQDECDSNNCEQSTRIISSESRSNGEGEEYSYSSSTDVGTSNKTAMTNCSSGDEMEDLVSGEPKDMLSINQRNKLTKEGYKIIGSHSAVKLCRWTKSHIRGRGGCYKHTFYGIISYQCMEATPSLACANKCVFCWRHHKNPVGTKWKWNKDNAESIVEQSVKKHQGMIKELKGVQSVISERFTNGMNIRHCALSLVGEPIMYPDINKLIDELHKRKISTFLVTNAQFPEELKKLHKVTQLYISIDAPNKEALRNIDRPLFKDYWERYITCIKILKTRKERSVFRFTLVKEYNMMGEEILGYSKLIELGSPDFIEIKAVTYCGSSEGYQLTMKNIPWHEEVYQFAFHLINSKQVLSDIYEITCEHKHSCSILIAKRVFKINNKWCTWINYEKFHLLVKEKKDFTAIDYCLETPSWALIGAPERGFNPADQRVYTKGKNKVKNVNVNIPIENDASKGGAP
ncbi:tRNA-YW synthesizing protein, putative [Plasmodium malariae]|uniref:tRNA 4-demethylwyosine synthase (AdoMet-dependent) n=2 Tax=Plasmodium malariae TaxID=5858 RepID=A0A1D3RHR9_PLAMA|nr:tRNA-YW synthesizing protein, putative [Plasmodium malariae]SCN44690.1 tRNA-YW synthesizing protein, putative [Plasmodium malariae]